MASRKIEKTLHNESDRKFNYSIDIQSKFNFYEKNSSMGTFIYSFFMALHIETGYRLWRTLYGF